MKTKNFKKIDIAMYVYKIGADIWFSNVYKHLQMSCEKTLFVCNNYRDLKGLLLTKKWR